MHITDRPTPPEPPVASTPVGEPPAQRTPTPWDLMAWAFSPGYADEAVQRMHATGDHQWCGADCGHTLVRIAA